MERISASSPVKRWVLAILPMLALKKGCAWVRVAPVPASPLLTGCGRSDNSTFAGTGRGTGFSGPNKELHQGKAAARPRARFPASRRMEGPKERGLARGALG